MKRLALMLCTLALLTACGEEPLDWTPTPATPQPTPTPSAETEAPWAALTVDDLPTALAEPDDLFSGEEPQVYLLGCKLEEGIYLYGLNEGYGGGVLLRRGEDLAHFDQSFSPSESPALPELYLSDFDGNGVEELAVRYLMESQGERISYDLHLYAWEGGLCSDRPITHGDCAQKALEAVETEYDAATGRFTLSYGNTSAVYRLPDQYRSAPGSLTLDSCFFRERDGVFTVVLGARLDTTGTLFANVLADIDLTEEDFVLRSIRVEPTTVV